MTELRCYREFTILSDPEFPVTTLMNAFFAKLHRAIVNLDERPAVLFPQYSKQSLGNRIAVFNCDVMQTDWLRGMRDHVEVSDLRDVPTTGTGTIVRRVRAKSVERERRRLRKRGLDENKFPLDACKRLELPYISISSASTQQQFKLFVEQQRVNAECRYSGADSYGFSCKTVLPAL